MNAELRGMGMLTDDNQANWDGKTWAEKSAALREMKYIIQRAILSADATAVTALALSTSKAVSEAAQAELSPEHQRTLELLLGERYQEGLYAGLYTAEEAPKAKVEAWLMADTTRLDAAAKWEARGGKPMFVGEFEGEWWLAECSEEVPPDIRNICYGPNGAKQQGLSEDRNALSQAENLGGKLLPKGLGDRLDAAGLIKNPNSWEWRMHPNNRDLEIEGYFKDDGIAWFAGYGNVFWGDPLLHTDTGGLRCSLSGSKL